MKIKAMIILAISLNMIISPFCGLMAVPSDFSVVYSSRLGAVLNKTATNYANKKTMNKTGDNVLEEMVALFIGTMQKLFPANNFSYDSYKLYQMLRHGISPEARMMIKEVINNIVEHVVYNMFVSMTDYDGGMYHAFAKGVVFVKDNSHKSVNELLGGDHVARKVLCNVCGWWYVWLLHDVFGCEACDSNCIAEDVASKYTHCVQIMPRRDIFYNAGILVGLIMEFVEEFTASWGDSALSFDSIYRRILSGFSEGRQVLINGYSPDTSALIGPNFLEEAASTINRQERFNDLWDKVFKASNAFEYVEQCAGNASLDVAANLKNNVMALMQAKDADGINKLWSAIDWNKTDFSAGVFVNGSGSVDWKLIVQLFHQINAEMLCDIITFIKSPGSDKLSKFMGSNFEDKDGVVIEWQSFFEGFEKGEVDFCKLVVSHSHMGLLSKLVSKVKTQIGTHLSHMSNLFWYDTIKNAVSQRNLLQTDCVSCIATYLSSVTNRSKNQKKEGIIVGAFKNMIPKRVFSAVSTAMSCFAGGTFRRGLYLIGFKDQELAVLKHLYNKQDGVDNKADVDVISRLSYNYYKYTIFFLLVYSMCTKTLYQSAGDLFASVLGGVFYVR